MRFFAVSLICSLGGSLSHGSPVVVFLADRMHACFWNLNSTVPIDVFRVRSYVNCLFDPKCVVMRITINKLNFVPEWQMSVLWSCSETAESGYGLVGFLDHAQSCMGPPVSPM